VSLKERCQNYFIGKIRDHVQYERAIMAVRFTDYFVGTQFHPEADPVSFVSHLRNKEAKEK
jgi:imidazoleglycerol phosphate synthase glutamine amidotransferase subunit HisH